MNTLARMVKENRDWDVELSLDEFKVFTDDLVGHEIECCCYLDLFVQCITKSKDTHRLNVSVPSDFDAVFILMSDAQDIVEETLYFSVNHSDGQIFITINEM